MNLKTLPLSILRFIYLLLILLVYIQNHSLIAQDKKEKKLMFRDTTDGSFDLSIFLLENEGVLPVVNMINEPALGYGGGMALVFFHPQKKEYDVNVPPNISGVIGLYTENETWLVGAFHYHVWGPDKIRYFGAFGKPVIHVDYYGNKNDYLDENPARLNLDGWTLIQRVQARVGTTNLFVGGAYMLFTSNNSVDEIPDKPLINEELSSFNGKSVLSMIQPIVNWDSRDNIFTTTKGLNTGIEFTYNAKWLGADDDFYKLNSYFLAYQPVSKKVFSAWRFDGDYIFGNPPIHVLPSVNLRGVPALRYQSDITMLVETEWRFVVYKKWSLNAFSGTGKAFESFPDFNSETWISNYGLGFRYELAKALGLHAGLDFAWSSKGDFIVYLILGTRWGK